MSALVLSASAVNALEETTTETVETVLTNEETLASSEEMTTAEEVVTESETTVAKRLLKQAAGAEFSYNAHYTKAIEVSKNSSERRLFKQIIDGGYRFLCMMANESLNAY